MLVKIDVHVLLLHRVVTVTPYKLLCFFTLVLNIEGFTMLCIDCFPNDMMIVLLFLDNYAQCLHFHNS